MRNKTIFDFFSYPKVKSINKITTPSKELPKQQLTVKAKKEKSSDEEESDFYDPNQMLNKKTTRQDKSNKYTALESRFIDLQPPNQKCHFSLAEDDLSKRIEDNNAIMKNVLTKNKASHAKPLFSVTKKQKPTKREEQLRNFLKPPLPQELQQGKATTKPKICSLFLTKAIPINHPNFHKVSEIFTRGSFKRRGDNY